MKRFDLHTHTTFSDGSCTPQKLFEAAKLIGLNGLSITDHDTVEAYYHLPKTDLTIGIGVEFSCFHHKESVHILGYDFIIDHPAITVLCERHKNRRLDRNLAILKNLQKLGILITEDELYSKFQDRSVGRPHIAQLLVDKGACHSIEQAFKEYLAEGKKAYAQGEMISVVETIDIIRQAEGKAFIAHPHVIRKQNIIRALKEMAFDGIEVFYARYTKNEVLRWLNLAQEKKWLKSGGSDFHGDFKTFNQLGSSWVDEEAFDLIFQRPLKT
jgi:predicted metal-dependent phosphoesterase TrpH